MTSTFGILFPINNTGQAAKVKFDNHYTTIPAAFSEVTKLIAIFLLGLDGEETGAAPAFSLAEGRVFHN